VAGRLCAIAVPRRTILHGFIIVVIRCGHSVAPAISWILGRPRRMYDLEPCYFERANSLVLTGSYRGGRISLGGRPCPPSYSSFVWRVESAALRIKQRSLCQPESLPSLQRGSSKAASFRIPRGMTTHEREVLSLPGLEDSCQGKIHTLGWRRLNPNISPPVPTALPLVRKDRKAPPNFRKFGRLDCPGFSRSPLGFSLSRVGNT